MVSPLSAYSMMLAARNPWDKGPMEAAKAYIEQQNQAQSSEALQQLLAGNTGSIGALSPDLQQAYLSKKMEAQAKQDEMANTIKMFRDMGILPQDGMAGQSGAPFGGLNGANAAILAGVNHDFAPISGYISATEARQQAAQDREAARKEAADERKEMRIQNNVKDLKNSLTKEDFPALISAFEQADTALSPYPEGTDIPGFGSIEGRLPEGLMGSKAKAVRQGVQGLKIYLSHKFNGSAQSRQEIAGVMQLLGMPLQQDPNDFDFTMVGEPELRRGMQMVRRQLVNDISNQRAGYDSEVIDRYKEQFPSEGSSVFDWADKQGGAQPSSGLSADEQKELDILRKKYGR